jgi:ribosome-associated protein
LSNQEVNRVLASPAKKPSGAPARPRSTSRSRKKDTVAIDQVEHLRQRVKAALDELKAKDVREIDVRGKTSIADFLVIASGTSTRHVKSIADEVVRYAKQAGMMPLGVEGQRDADWVLVDLGDIIVHVMLPRIREFYGLERLWTVGDDLPVAANAD